MSEFDVLLVFAFAYVLWRLDHIGRQIEAVNADIKAGSKSQCSVTYFSVHSSSDIGLSETA